MLTSADRMRARRTELLAQKGSTAELVLVTGPPCSGKTTHVRENAVAGDLVIDFDALAVALGSPSSHDHLPSMIPVVTAAWLASMAEAKRHPGRVWLVRGFPSANDFAEASRVVTLAVPAETCKQRAASSGRPEGWPALIDKWWAAAPA